MGVTTDRNDPGLKETKPGGQQEKYLVLSAEEKVKGFVRPVRLVYAHVGRRICGKPVFEDSDIPEGKVGYVCTMERDHEDDCYVGKAITKAEKENLIETGTLGGCDATTKMHSSIAETYARDPKFYGATYCTSCQKHLPVNEFVWDGTDEEVGS